MKLFFETKNIYKKNSRDSFDIIDIFLVQNKQCFNTRKKKLLTNSFAGFCVRLINCIVRNTLSRFTQTSENEKKINEN